MYDSWASRIRLFIKGKKHGRMMLDSIDNGPLVYPTVEEDGQTRPKKYSELTEAQQLQDDCDVQATISFFTANEGVVPKLCGVVAKVTSSLQGGDKEVKEARKVVPKCMRMEQYLTHTDYALWEVIVNGDAPAITSASIEGPIPPKDAEQKLSRKNELKGKSTLLLAIPDEHLLKFHGIMDAKTLWEAIKTRFGGNKESKKM
ncbi:hypothetical protein Tco_0507760 [Tanacetum coccineum]